MNPINRREAIRVMGAGALAVATKAADSTPFHFTALDHLEISEPDSAKSAALYARIFGGPIWKNNKTPRRYVKLGPAYIAIEQGREPFGVDHFSAGIEGYQIAEIHAYLNQRGIAYRDYPSENQDLNVTDPDGIHLHYSFRPTTPRANWKGAPRLPNQISPPADHRFSAPQGVRPHPAERLGPRKIHCVLRKNLRPGHAAQQQPNLVPGRQNPASGFCKRPRASGPASTTSAQPPRLSTMTPSLQNAAAGGMVRARKKPEIAGAPEFRDLDGLLVQIMTPRQQP